VPSREGSGASETNLDRSRQRNPPPDRASGRDHRPGKVRRFCTGDLTEFHETGGELVRREVFHIQKEEMAFLATLAQMLDEDKEDSCR
jgi:hypothetical protein